MKDQDAPSGRELDALIAEKVMGWRCVHLVGMGPYVKPYWLKPPEEWAKYKPECVVTNKLFNDFEVLETMPHYSTDIAAAWQVVEKMRDSQRWCCIEICSDYNYCWDVKITPSELDGKSEHKPIIIETNESLPEAICRAALLAVEKQ